MRAVLFAIVLMAAGVTLGGCITTEPSIGDLRQIDPRG